MLHNIDNIDKRDKAVLVGLFLSRFDKQALESFGFTGFRQAYNVLGLSIGFIPKSIQNYRDEFDPYFPNKRKGWHNRRLRDYSKELMDATADMSFDEFYNVIKFFLDVSYFSYIADVIAIFIKNNKIAIYNIVFSKIF